MNHAPPASSPPHTYPIAAADAFIDLVVTIVLARAHHQDRKAERLKRRATVLLATLIQSGTEQ